jgi:hypothetical protein
MINIQDINKNNNVPINTVINGDCLEVMKYIPDKSIDAIICDLPVKKIIKLYTEEKYTLRRIAEVYNTNHHRIKRILIKNNITITQKDRKRKPFTDEHKNKLKLSRKKLYENGYVPYNKGLKTLTRKNGKELLYKNMKAHLQWDITLDRLLKFNDIEKIKFLNKTLSKDRISKYLNTDFYIKYIEKFYYDEKFNIIYDNWIDSKNKWKRPSLDHIIPTSKGGKHDDINNLQFLTWFENKAKFNILPDDWSYIKEHIGEYLL